MELEHRLREEGAPPHRWHPDLRQAGVVRGQGHLHADRAAGGGRDGRAARRERHPAGLLDGRHLRRGVRRGDALLLRHVRVGGLAAGGAAGQATGRAGHRLRPGAHRAGHRVRLLRRPGRRRAPPRGLGGGDGQLQPGDRVHRLRRLVPALLRAAGRGERAGGHPRGDRGRGRAAAGAGPVRWPDAAQPRRRRWSPRAWTCRACRWRPSTSPRSARSSPTSWSGWASRSRRAASPPRWRRRSPSRTASATRSSCGRPS